jgi:putative tryptophan/tyrosine transport system substrate-binding protein
MPYEGHMQRREFITFVGSVAVLLPAVARAQPQTPAVIGFLGPLSAESDAYRVEGFRQGLKEAGYVEGTNLTVDYRWAEGHYDRFLSLAADLVGRKVALIAAISTPAALAAKAATTTIPVVFETAGDPVKLGLVASLARPGGNVTGVTQLGEEVLPKRVELLHELIPTARVLALLNNPASGFAEDQARAALAVANSLGFELHIINARNVRDFDTAFAKLIELKVEGLVIAGDILFTGHANELAALTLKHKIPAIYQRREFAAAGGLISYGSNTADTHRLAGIYAGRILKGEKPADLPVQQATKVELYINVATAKALGLTVPIPLIGRADEVIE